MKSTVNRPLHYIRKNRKETAMIYLKENDQKIAQRLFCYLSALDNEYQVVGETTSLEEVKNCDLMLVANLDIFLKNIDVYFEIKKELEQRGVGLKVAVDETNEREYIERALDLFKKA